ncbi:MAG: c-type cytochrome, partial [Planctomycetota bacterium]
IHYFEDTHVAPGSCAALKSDKRSVLYGRFSYDRDTHGMTGNFVRGFDGWIYGTHGFNNISTIKGSDGSEITMNSGNTYRIRADGSRVEQYTWGQVNPFGLAFDEFGNLYSADCHSKPIYHLLRGAFYPSFGKKDDGLGFGPEMMQHSHGSTAIGGIVIYSDTRFPEEFRNNAFSGNVMTCKVNQDLLVDSGATRIAKEQPDFLSAGDPWFRPVCLQLGPDGALYVADFYNRIIGHYEVPLTHPGRDRERGRIWRIVYTGSPEKPVADKRPPDLSGKSAEELVAVTADANLTLRMLAMSQLVDRLGAEAVEPCKAALMNGTPNQKICALWTLFNLKKLEEAALAGLATDGDRTVRAHAMKAVSELEKASDSQHGICRLALADSDAWVRRAAADALGRHPSVENIRPLLALKSASDASDTHLIHVVRMALRNHLLGKGSGEKLASLNPPLDAKELEALAGVALGAQSEDAAGVIARFLETSKAPAAEVARYVQHAIKFLPSEQVDAFVVRARKMGSDDAAQLEILKALQDGAARRGLVVGADARAWAVELLGRVLAASDSSGKVEIAESNGLSDARKLQSAMELAGRFKLAEFESRASAVWRDKKNTEAVRGAAATALVLIDPAKHAAEFLTALKDPAELNALRERAAEVLGASDAAAVRGPLIEAMRGAHDKLQTKIALALSARLESAEALLSAIAEGKASPRVLFDKAVKDRLAQLRMNGLDERIAKLTKALPAADQHLQKLIDARVKGFSSAKSSAELGAKVFEKNCMVCHQIDGKGALIGPQLDGVGARGLERIAEDVLDPNRNVDSAFRMSMVKLANGSVHSGLKRREEGAQIVFADSKGVETSLAKNEIKEIRETPLSLMPDGMADAIPAEEFNHLMAYLLSKTVKR